MRSLLVLPFFVALTMGRHVNPPSMFTDDTQAMDAATDIEESILMEERRHPPTHLQEEIPHPHLVHPEHPQTRTASEESLMKTLGKALNNPQYNPVPDPHLVEEATEHHHNGAADEESLHPHRSVEVIRHNAVEIPLEMEDPEDATFQGTKSPFDEGLFENHPNTEVAEFEATVGTEAGNELEVVQEPVVLPVTEGKNRGQDASHYGLPKELMPIHPGGGSKFDDLEREKLEKKKMAQTKGTDDEDTENGASHEAEGLYSCAATLYLSSIILSLSSSFRIIV